MEVLICPGEDVTSSSNLGSPFITICYVDNHELTDTTSINRYHSTLFPALVAIRQSQIFSKRIHSNNHGFGYWKEDCGPLQRKIILPSHYLNPTRCNISWHWSDWNLSAVYLRICITRLTDPFQQKSHGGQQQEAQAAPPAQPQQQQQAAPPAPAPAPQQVST